MLNYINMNDFLNPSFTTTLFHKALEQPNTAKDTPPNIVKD